MSHSSHLLSNSLNLYLCLLQLFHDVHRVSLGLQWLSQDSLTPTQPAVKWIVKTLWKWQVSSCDFMPSQLICDQFTNHAILKPNYKYLIIPYSRKLSREKTFANFEILWLFASFSPQNLGAWHLLAAAASNTCETFLSKDRFLTNSRKFSSAKFSSYTVITSSFPGAIPIDPLCWWVHVWRNMTPSHTWYFSASAMPSFSFPSRVLRSERVLPHASFRSDSLILPESRLSSSWQPSTSAVPFVLTDSRESSWFLKSRWRAWDGGSNVFVDHTHYCKSCSRIGRALVNNVYFCWPHPLLSILL